MVVELMELNKKETQKAVEAALEKYRLFKYLAFEEKEAAITSGTEIRYHGRTNQISDQTGDVAISNVDQQEYRRSYCERIERAVERLPKMERFLIEERYMSEDGDYVTDLQVYYFKFEPPISPSTYSKIRWKAFYKLALSLNIAVTK